VVLWFANAYQLFVLGTIIIYAIGALGLDWLTGRAGQASLGNAALMAIGAYTTALTAAQSWAPFPVPVVFSALAGSVIGLMVGLPALRLRGLYLVLSTLALQFVVMGLGDYYQGRLGAQGGFRVAPPVLFGYTFTNGIPWILMLLVILIAVMFGLRNMYRGAPGRAWLAIKETEVGAATIGIDVIRWKLLAFVGSSALIAVAGSLFAYYTRVVAIDTFSLTFAISFVVMVILGGMGTMQGALLGAAIVGITPIALQQLTQSLPISTPGYRFLSANVFYLNDGLYGLILLLALLYVPGGLASIAAKVPRLSRARRGSSSLPLVHRPEASTKVPIGGSRPLLELRRLSVTYESGARAVTDLDLDLRSGQIVALLGQNGAGKTSTLRAIAGYLGMDRVKVTGEILLEGRSIVGSHPYRTSQYGVVLVPERGKVFPNLTVREHLRAIAPKGRVRYEVADLMVPLAGRENVPAGLLSGGQRQLLALAIAWCRRPRLILIDELSLGLAPVMVEQLLLAVRTINHRDGTGVLLVEQNTVAALSIADHAYVLDAGMLIAHGPSREVERQISGISDMHQKRRVE
jgi:branched-chain amino acid transport system permease protein